MARPRDGGAARRPPLGKDTRVTLMRRKRRKHAGVGPDGSAKAGTCTGGVRVREVSDESKSGHDRDPNGEGPRISRRHDQGPGCGASLQGQGRRAPDQLASHDDGPLRQRVPAGAPRGRGVRPPEADSAAPRVSPRRSALLRLRSRECSCAPTCNATGTVDHAGDRRGWLLLGQYQSVIVAELDGPRDRRFQIHIIGE